MKKQIYIYATLFFLILFNLNFILAEEFGYNLLESGKGLSPDTNFSLKTVNASEIWITDQGNLNTANITQFDGSSDSQTLNIKESWLTSLGNSLWCALTGCTMQGDIDMNNNNITNVDWINGFNRINGSGDITTTGNILIGSGTSVTDFEIRSAVSPAISIIHTLDGSVGSEAILSFAITNSNSLSRISRGDRSIDFVARREISQHYFLDLFLSNGGTSVKRLTVDGDTGEFDFLNNSINNIDNATILNSIFFDDVDHFLKRGAEDMFGGISEETFWFGHEEEREEGTITFLVSANKTNSDIDAVNIMSQVGRNNSAGVLGNSWMILPNNLTSNLTIFSNCFLVANELNKTLRVSCDTGDSGADFIVQDSIQAFGEVFADGGIRAETLVDFVMNGRAVTIQNGSLHIFTPVTFETGVTQGEDITTFAEDFVGDLGSFTNLQVDVGNWFATSSVFCADGDCAESIGISGVGNIIMEANISTININSTTLNFVYSLVNMLGANSFSVTANNNVGSGEVTLLTDSTTNVALSSQSIEMPSTMWDQPKVSIRYECDVTNTNRQCFVDTISVNGSAIATTLTNQSGFNSEFRLGAGTLRGDGSGRSIFDIFWNDSIKTLELPGNVSFESVTEVDINITGSITLFGEAITNWDNVSNFDDNVLLRDGSRALTGNWDAGSFDITTTGIINANTLIGTSVLTSTIANIANDNRIDVEGFELLDSSIAPAINWNNRILTDENGAFSVDFTSNRFLADAVGGTSLGWETRALVSGDGNDVILDWATVGLAQFGDSNIQTTGDIDGASLTTTNSNGIISLDGRTLDIQSLSTGGNVATLSFSTPNGTVGAGIYAVMTNNVFSRIIFARGASNDVVRFEILDGNGGDLEMYGQSPTIEQFATRSGGGVGIDAFSQYFDQTSSGAGPQNVMKIGTIGDIGDPSTATYSYWDVGDDDVGSTNSVLKIGKGGGFGLNTQFNGQPTNLIEANQYEDLNGIKLFGFDDQSAAFLHSYIDSSGEPFMVSSSGAINFGDDKLNINNPTSPIDATGSNLSIHLSSNSIIQGGDASGGPGILQFLRDGGAVSRYGPLLMSNTYFDVDANTFRQIRGNSASVDSVAMTLNALGNNGITFSYAEGNQGADGAITMNDIVRINGEGLKMLGNNISTGEAQTSMILRGIDSSELGGFSFSGWGFTSQTGSNYQGFAYFDGANDDTIYAIRTSADSGSNWKDVLSATQNGDISIGTGSLNITQNLTVGSLIKLGEITLPNCGTPTNGSIARNGTGVYGCNHTGTWNRLF